MPRPAPCSAALLGERLQRARAEIRSGAEASKHEINRAKTRSALVTAARRLVLTRGYGHFTVNDVAEAAGCSRRTVFNYYPTLAEAILDPLLELIDQVLDVLEAQPEEASVLDVVFGGLPQVSVTDEDLQVIAMMVSLSEEHPELKSSAALGWSRLEQGIRRVLAPRVPDAEPLVLRALVHAVADSAAAGAEAAAAAFTEDRSADLLTTMNLATERTLQIHLRGLAAELPSSASSASPAASTARLES